ncbi:MAG: trimethylamine methyltransferase family protein [Acetivibrionales bacterium]|jgi:trimethylamine--corrinoid protein Co-methyltransferase
MFQSSVKVLTAENMQRVHDISVHILEKKGMVFDSAEALAYFKEAGLKVEGKTVYFTRKVLEDSIKQCPETFYLNALDPQKSVTVGEGMLVGPAGGALFVSDMGNGRRVPLLSDCADLQKLYQACKNVDLAGHQPLTPSDVPERYQGLYLTLVSFRHCNKPILSPTTALPDMAMKNAHFALYEIAYGKKGYLNDHYVTYSAVCPNSPLFYGEFACDGIIAFAKWNQPVLCVSAPMSGITSPFYLYSTVALHNAENLAGIALAQLVRPGVPCIGSASLTYGNMKYATWECACPDSVTMMLAAIQMYNEFYHLPSRAQTGATSSKTLDMQAGLEGMQSFLTTALAGVNITTQSVGTLENLTRVSFEKTVIDDELIDRVRRIMQGLDTGEKCLALDEIMNADPHSDFIMSNSTLENFREGWQPTVSNWMNHDLWRECGQTDLIETARGIVTDILENAPESLLDSEQEKEMQDYIRHVEKSDL